MKLATNDPAESLFASLTRQLQAFGRVLGIHSSAVGQARVNGDFERKHINGLQDGAYHCLPPNIRQSLMKFALKIAPNVRRSEKRALDKQQDPKQKKQDLLQNKKMLAVQKEYANALMYIDMFHSPACWQTKNDAQKAFE